MNRQTSLSTLEKNGSQCDVLVIGGGATGLGAARDAAARGFSTLLAEKGDFAQGTSSRSTKLIHGGVRYLQQMNIALVRDSLRERQRLLTNAPELVQWREFVIPATSHWNKWYYGAGLKTYDLLAGGSGRKSQLLNRSETFNRLPEIKRAGIRGGVSYWDGQFDDAQLALALATEIHAKHGVAINYLQFDSFITAGERICGARLRDVESGRQFEVAAKVVINATGVHSDEIRQEDKGEQAPLIAASRGSHIVLPLNRLGGDSALMLPKTKDGRVLFAIPWREHLMVGTTDVATTPVAEPSATAEEVEFLLEHINEYVQERCEAADVLSCYAGLRPLVRQTKASSTASMSRDHHIEVSPAGLITIVGGKWTTFRKMSEDVIDRAIEVGRLPSRACPTANLPIPSPFPKPNDERIDPRLPLTPAQVTLAVQKQMAIRLEDVLARRSRCLFLNAHATMEIAPTVARLMAQHAERDEEWTAREVTSFKRLANSYLPGRGED